MTYAVFCVMMVFLVACFISCRFLQNGKGAIFTKTMASLGFIVGAVLANKGLAVYNTNPSGYNGYGMLKAGKVTSILGIVFGAIYTLYYIVAVAILGSVGLAWLDWLDMF